MMMIKNTNKLEIQLVENEIFLQSNQEGVASIWGQVQLESISPLKVTSLHLTLIGTLKTNWSSEGRVYRDKVEVLRNEWVLLPKQTISHILSTGKHFYPFQGVLDQGLPASLSCRSGKVDYRLTAILNTGKWWDTKVSRIIKVTKAELPSNSTMLDSIYATGSYLDLFSYQLSCPHRAFGPDDKIPIKFLLSPINSGAEIESISCLIKRTITMKTRVYGNHWVVKSNEEIINIEHLKYTNSPRSINETLYLNVKSPKQAWPSKSPKFVPSTSNLLMDIKHEVKARIIFRSPNGISCDMILKFKIVVMTLNRDQIFLGLPSYNNRRDTVLIECVPPSYRSTWCPLSTRPSLSSLPGYEDVTYRSYPKTPPSVSRRRIRNVHSRSCLSSSRTPVA